MQINMKLRYIIGAVLGTLLFVGCQQEELVGNYADLSVDKTFVPISMDGGSASVKVTSASTWSIAGELPTWLTASSMSGNAGSADVTFTATSTTAGREAEIEIKSGDKSQFLRVRQGTLEATSATVKEIYAGPDGKTYRVKGTCTGIYNTQYGNWYLDDGSNGDKVLTIYGTLDKDGKTKNFTSLGIEVGDVVTVEGPKTTYGTTIELVDVTVLKIEKALVKIVAAPEAAAPKEGAEVTVTVAYKGSGVYPTVADGAKDWLVYKKTEFKVGDPTIFEKAPADTAFVTFTLAANAGGAREGVVNFTSSTSAKNSTTVPVTIQQEGAIQEITVAEFLAAKESGAVYRISGIVAELYPSDTQNKSFYIQDYSGKVLVYRAEGFETSGAKVGDIVTVTGVRTSYKGTPQMGTATFESLDKVVATKTVAELRALEDDKNTYFMVTGKVVKSEEPNTKFDLETYGNLSLQDETGEIYVYGVSTGWNGASKQFGTLGVKEGDQLTVIGYRTSYTKGDYKLLQMGGAMYVSHVSANAE